MSKIAEAILAKGKAYAGHSPVLNLAYGGQNGQTAAIGRIDSTGTNVSEWISNQAHVRQNVIPIVLSYPKAFDKLPNPQMWINTYNAVMTLHPLTITGLKSGLTVDFDDHAVGGAGEVQSEITKVSREVTSVSRTYKDKHGKAIQKFIDMVIRYLYSDPDVGKPLISNIVPIADFGGMYTPDWYTGTELYIEPDVTQQYVVDAWLCTNTMFKGNGSREGGRDIHSARTTSDLSIDFTSITMNNEAVLKLADTMLASLNVLKTNPELDMVVPQSVQEPQLTGGATGTNSVSYNTVPNTQSVTPGPAL